VEFTPSQLSTLHQTCDLMPVKAAVMPLSAATLQCIHNVMSSGQLSNRLCCTIQLSPLARSRHGYKCFVSCPQHFTVPAVCSSEGWHRGTCSCVFTAVYEVHRKEHVQSKEMV